MRWPAGSEVQHVARALLADGAHWARTSAGALHVRRARAISQAQLRPFATPASALCLRRRPACCCGACHVPGLSSHDAYHHLSHHSPPGGSLRRGALSSWPHNPPAPILFWSPHLYTLPPPCRPETRSFACLHSHRRAPSTPSPRSAGTARDTRNAHSRLRDSPVELRRVAPASILPQPGPPPSRAPLRRAIHSRQRNTAAKSREPFCTPFPRVRLARPQREICPITRLLWPMVVSRQHHIPPEDAATVPMHFRPRPPPSNLFPVELTSGAPSEHTKTEECSGTTKAAARHAVSQSGPARRPPRSPGFRLSSLYGIRMTSRSLRFQ
jgi:hypothetical protein